MPFMRKDKLVAHCRQDRDFLLDEICKRHGLTDHPVPADVLDDIIVDVLGMSLVPTVMPEHLLGRCDFSARQIDINTRMPEITLPNTNIEGLINSTKAHELGHVRLNHERELRRGRDHMTLALFADIPVPAASLVCRRDIEQDRAVPAAERSREYQANYYASVFLVPERQLLLLPVAQGIQQAHETAATVPTRQLWAQTYELAAVFRVTPSLMARRLVDLGWIVMTRRGTTRDLAVRTEDGMPLTSVAG